MRFSACLILTLLIFACNQVPDAVPKPRAFPKIIYPERRYIEFKDSDCPFSFRYPDYFKIEKQTSFLGGTPSHPCWFDLVLTTFNARIHCSYVPVSDVNPLDALVRDAFTIANKINQRSNYMDEIRVGNAQGVTGLILEFQGPAASPMHFYLTDSTDHFLKASLYYNSKVRPDSLRPVTEFIKVDIAEMLNSFSWQ
jgi:gliding motility-associated lipoprotein GldD